ncbi:hypothetical protein JW887_06470 [Candidatus Dojkabacteria bacterium]|nr:hypothetical protein [Candidatus Dojkabacteria bacterium]
MIFFDVETKNSFDVNSPDSGLASMEVSFVGAFDDKAGKYYSFWEKDLPFLEELLNSGEMVVGYNSWAFDYGVLSKYFEFNIYSLPSLDLMVAMKNIVGFRPKLDDLARANFGKGKLGSGYDALLYWQKGDLDKLEKYCLEDVRLTYEVWKKGKEEGKLNYYTRSGFFNETEVNWDLGIMNKQENSESSDSQASFL